MVAWFGDPVIGGMITAAMVVNLLFADLAGTFIPLALDFFWVVIRPSAGPIFLTTVTDVVEFFRFLD